AVLTAMKGAAPPGVALDVWADGIAGLIVRQALERIERPSGPVGHVIFIDTPHRGRSSAGWPDWAAPGAIPEYAVTGSEFLTRLNASTTRNNIPYVNLARGPPGLPRSAVMQLPRAALHLVLDSPTPAPLWAVLRAPVIAVRQTGPEGPPPRDLPEGPSYRERHAAQYGPKKSTTTLPDLQSLLSAAAVPPESDKFWIEAPTARSGRMADPLSVMTDAVSIGYDPRSRDLIITGYVDYFRDPLRTDFFYAALRAYRTSVPAISIDPRRATDPPNQAPVRYEGGVNGTLLGGVMFEADRAMKTLGLSKDNVSSVPVSYGAPGYRSLMDTSGSGTGVQTVWRFWFEPVRWHARESSPLAALIDTRLRVNTQLMSPGVAPSGAATGFARGLTTEFAKYAQEQPSLDQLDQAAAVAAMARWTYEANLDSTPLSFGGLGRRALRRPFKSGPNTMQACTGLRKSWRVARSWASACATSGTKTARGARFSRMPSRPALRMRSRHGLSMMARTITLLSRSLRCCVTLASALGTPTPAMICLRQHIPPMSSSTSTSPSRNPRLRLRP